MEATNISIVVATIVGVLYPGYALYGGKNTYQILSTHPEKKLFIFRQTAIFLIILLAISILPLWLAGYDSALIGMGFITNPLMTAGLLVVATFVLWLLNCIPLTPSMAKKIYTANERVLPFLPATQSEYKLLVLVSFIAGICEEIVYRGFLFWFLCTYLLIPSALVLANLPFALAHLTTTGFRNSFFAFILGLLASLLFLLTKSLWLSILLHIIVDLYAITFAYKATRILASQNSDEGKPL